ncbi:MAG: DUF4142 domain-containing protein [Terriglobales bacterium]
MNFICIQYFEEEITMYIARVGGSLLLCGLLAVGAAAQMGSTKADSSKLDTADRQFVTKAAEGGMAEVELGKLAVDKGSSEDVKKFGQRMVNDHTKANDQLKEVARKEDVKLPDELSAKDRATKAHLEKLSGASFDRAYMSDMVRDHEKDVAEFSRESKMAKDPEVKNFASQTLPTLRDHLKNARSVASQTGAQASAKSPTGSK